MSFKNSVFNEEWALSLGPNCNNRDCCQSLPCFFHLYVRLKNWDLQELSIHISIYRRSIDACKSSVNTDRRLEFVDTEFKFVGNIYEQQIAR